MTQTKTKAVAGAALAAVIAATGLTPATAQTDSVIEREATVVSVDENGHITTSIVLSETTPAEDAQVFWHNINCRC